MYSCQLISRHMTEVVWGWFSSLGSFALVFILRVWVRVYYNFDVGFAIVMNIVVIMLFILFKINDL